MERLHEVSKGKPAKVFLLIGINDISRNIPDSVILENYREIVRRVKSESPATELYIQTLLLTNNKFTKFKRHYNKDEDILWLSRALRQLAAEEKVMLIDLYPILLTRKGGCWRRTHTMGCI